MKHRTAAIFYHVNDFNRPDAACVGHIARYLAKHNFEVIDYFWALRDDLPENTHDYDVLFIMGGPGSVYDTERPEWMDHEIHLIEQRIINQQKTIGICLGGQMLALASGGQVSSNHYFEFGFHPVSFLHDTGHPVLEGIPKTEIFMHWHHDGFCPPEGAISIATSDAARHELCDNECEGSQAFVYDSFLAIQFHPEMSLETVQINHANMTEDTERYKQSKSVVQELAPIYLASETDPSENCARDIFFKLLDNFLKPQNNDQ
ncbi:MAG: GMP synthase-like glutamine amidotransferase [Alphaproteobacteria bacterium]|jgi:GMP synthase-like glutamine amidotransferase